MANSINQYVLLSPFQNKEAGFSMWTFGQKNGKEYFLKQFLDCVYPLEESLSSAIIEQKRQICREYEMQKKKLYQAINTIADGNIVRIKEFFRAESHYYIVTEKIEALSVNEVSALSMEDRYFLCRSVAHCIKKLHLAGIVHADIKDTNVLLKRTTTGKIVGKIIDFDCGFFESEPPLDYEDLGGDQLYLSPEACRFMCGEDVKLDCKIDVFAMGLLFHMYLVGQLPEFDYDKYNYVYEAVLDGGEVDIYPELTPGVKKLLIRMLNEDPAERPTSEQVYNILNHICKYGDNNDGLLEQFYNNCSYDVYANDSDNSFTSNDNHAHVDENIIEENSNIDNINTNKKNSNFFFAAGDLAETKNGSIIMDQYTTSTTYVQVEERHSSYDSNLNEDITNYVSRLEHTSEHSKREKEFKTFQSVDEVIAEKSSNIYCGICGYMVRKGAHYCENCGHQLY